MKTLITTLISSLLFVAAGFAERVEFDSVAATVNNRPIMWSQVRGAVAEQLNQLHLRRHGLSLEEYANELNDTLIRGRDALIDRELILDHFDSGQGQISDIYVDTAVEDRIQEQFGGDRAAFQEHLAKFDLTFNQFRNYIRDEMVISLLQKNKAQAPLFVTPKEIEEVYLANRERFTTEGEVAISTITIPKKADGATLEQQLTKTREIHRQLQEGSDFALQARLNSIDSFAGRGGERPMTSKTDLVPEIHENVFATPVGKLSEIIELDSAYVILKVNDRVDDVLMPLEDVRPQVEMIAMQQKRSAVIKRWLTKLREDAHIRLKDAS
ncbi:MAG: peptidyl-prolyl cis-trans isomerase [Verrucomicrobiota bacterium]